MNAPAPLCPACHHPERMHAAIGEWCAGCADRCDGRPRPRSNLDRAALERIPVTPYAEIRSHLRTGDVALFSGGYPISRVIRWATGSPWSHAGVLEVRRDINAVGLWESVEGSGVRVSPLSRCVYGTPKQRYRGLCFLFRLRQEIDPEKQREGDRWAFDQQTEDYGTAQLVALGLGIVLGDRVLGFVKDGEQRICSAAAAERLRRYGALLQPPHRRWHSPAELAADPAFELVARVL